MTGEKWTVYWNEYSANTYLYGSRVLYHARDDVEFQNILMPPGTILRSGSQRRIIRCRESNPRYL